MVSLRFDCDRTGPGYERSAILASQRVRVERYHASVTRTVSGVVEIAEATSTIWLNRAGTFLIRQSPDSKVMVVPPECIAYVRGPASMVVHAAKGEHVTELIVWPNGNLPALESWINAQRKREMGAKPMHHALAPALARYEECKTAGELAEPLLFSSIFELTARLLVGADEFQLASVPSDLPPTILELTHTVRKDPSQPWPLKDAADAAGYSPFHFSRVFKSLAGFGFHEYVDRCRTEMAIDMLCSTDEPIDNVAASCGFGTTQGLRESVKEYLGLVPSELRAVPQNPPHGL